MKTWYLREREKKTEESELFQISYFILFYFFFGGGRVLDLDRYIYIYIFFFKNKKFFGEGRKKKRKRKKGRWKEGRKGGGRELTFVEFSADATFDVFVEGFVEEIAAVIAELHTHGDDGDNGDDDDDDGCRSSQVVCNNLVFMKFLGLSN